MSVKILNGAHARIPRTRTTLRTCVGGRGPRCAAAHCTCSINVNRLRPDLGRSLLCSGDFGAIDMPAEERPPSPRATDVRPPPTERDKPMLVAAPLGKTITSKARHGLANSQCRRPRAAFLNSPWLCFACWLRATP